MTEIYDNLENLSGFLTRQWELCCQIRLGLVSTSQTCSRPTPSEDPVYLLFWVLTAVTMPHWVLVPNAVRYWSIGKLSIFPTILRNRVLDFTRIATCCRVTAPAMPQEGGGLSLQRPQPLRSEPTRHAFLGAAGSMELRRSTTQQNLHGHRAAGTVAATHTILRNLHEQRLFTIKSDCTHDPHR